jgi:uncharacterized protein YgbK (DUF1537 family)
VLVYSTRRPGESPPAQSAAGDVGQRLESLLAGTPVPWSRRRAPPGRRRGRDLGRVRQALGVRQLRIGAQIDPGVPWCHAAPRSRRRLHLALKSGNFGGVDFFSRAFAAAA